MIDIEQELVWAPWKEYTPTLYNCGPGAGTTVLGRYRRAGTSADVDVTVTFAGSNPTGSSWELSLPSGWTTEATTNRLQQGSLVMNDTGTVALHGVCYLDAGGSAIKLRSLNLYGGTYLAWTGIGTTAPFTWTAGDFFVAKIRLELQP